MYFDADHDLAHEFYEETSIQMPGGRVRLVMKRIKHNLIPQVMLHCVYNWYCCDIQWNVFL